MAAAGFAGPGEARRPHAESRHSRGWKAEAGGTHPMQRCVRGLRRVRRRLLPREAASHTADPVSKSEPRGPDDPPEDGVRVQPSAAYGLLGL